MNVSMAQDMSQKNFKDCYETPDSDVESTSPVTGKATLDVSVDKMIPANEDADGIKEGGSNKNQYIVTVEDPYFGIKQEKKVYVTVRQPKYSSLSTIKLVAAKGAKVSTTVSGVANALNNDNVLRVAVYDNSGVFVAYENMLATAGAVTLTKSNKAKDVFVADDYDPQNPNVTLGAIYGALTKDEVPGEWATNVYDKITFVYRGYKVVSGDANNTIDGNINVATKAEAGKYKVKVTGIKLNVKSASQDFFTTGSSCVLVKPTTKEDKAKSIALDITVEDSQAVPTWSQTKKTVADVGVGSLREALKVTCSDTAPRMQVYDPSSDQPQPDYEFGTVKNSYFVNESGVTFTKAVIYVPYPDGLYVENTVNAAIAYKAE
jgi:flagellar hook assembly protein FlgD